MKTFTLEEVDRILATLQASFQGAAEGCEIAAKDHAKRGDSMRHIQALGKIAQALEDAETIIKTRIELKEKHG